MGGLELGNGNDNNNDYYDNDEEDDDLSSLDNFVIIKI